MRWPAFMMFLGQLAACGHAPDAEPTPKHSRASLVGVWSRPLAGDETNRLVLFDSGIMAFQHLGAKLPISRAYGRWSLVDDKIVFDIVGVEPERASAPPATISMIAFEREWTSVPGRDSERDWTFLVENAEKD